MAKMTFSVVTPEGAEVETEVFSVTLPGIMGELCILPQHCPGLIQLGGGLVSYEGIESNDRFFVRGGVAEIGREHILVLTDAMARAGEFDRGEAERLVADAEARLEKAEAVGDELLRAAETDRGFGEAILRSPNP